MSALSDYVAPDPPYHDQPLELGEFRLITVEETGELSLRHVYPWIIPNDSLRLVMRRHKLTDKPIFSAVSYVWGNATSSVSVACNNKRILVTPPVFEMLEHLRTHDLPLWIDAICINQQDDAEKSTQIPLMGRIYANAVSALVWLGLLPVRPRVQNFMLFFPHVCQSARNWLRKNVPFSYHPIWRGEEWPPIGDDFWIGLYWLLDHDWFRRLWTFQEAILPASIIFAVGPLTLDGNDLLQFVVDGAFQAMSYPKVDPWSLSILGKNVKTSDLAFDACHLIQSVRSQVVYGRSQYYVGNWPGLLAQLREREAKEPVDRVWATTALLREDLQNRLAPMIDYSEMGLKEYWKTYIRWVKFIVEVGQDLTFLQYPRSIERDSTKLPTWCPDLVGKPASLVKITGHWNSTLFPQRRSMRSFITSDSDVQGSWENLAAIHGHQSFFAASSHENDLLQVRGFTLDRISKIVDDPRLMNFSRHDRHDFRNVMSTMFDPLHAAAMEFYRRASELAQSVYNVPQGAACDIPFEYLMCIFADHRISVETPQAYCDAYTDLTTDGDEFWKSLDDHRRQLANECIGMLANIVGHVFFTTEGGRFGIASPGCKPGDTICTFYGGPPLYILRWPDEGERAIGTEQESNIAEFCGVAYIPYLMEQHQREAARLGADEIFVMG
jgi:hypothetical protein